MASVCGRALQSRNAVSKLNNTFKLSCFNGTTPSKFPGFSPSLNPRFSLHKFFTSSRIPVELGCAQSLMPMHSVTASALFTSLLSLHSQSWGCLSEGFATPL